MSLINCTQIRQNYTKLSRKAFAEEIGVPYTTYVEFEKGREPNLQTIIKISQYLKLPVDLLLGNAKQYTPKQQEAIKSILLLNEANLEKIIERAKTLKELE